MKLLAWMLILFLGVAQAQTSAPEISSNDHKVLLKNASEYFTQGKYEAVIEELNGLEASSAVSDNKNLLGLISYWKGITYNKLQEYPLSIESFAKAINYEYIPQDLHYEYGQVLYASLRYDEARVQFSLSVKRKFKRAVSLYYIGFISRELGDKKKAYTFFKAINKLGPEESKEVLQAAETQIGDIYLEQVEHMPNAFKEIDTYVIPQYQLALNVDPNSSLAPSIQEKIVGLQRKYDLILFRLMNGRPTLNPPYLLRIAQEVGQDTNVTFAPANTTISSSDQSSIYTKTDIIGRYTFYLKDRFAITPEFRFNNTHYFNRVPSIYRNDNYLVAPALRTAYEHYLWKKPASFLFDYDYNEAHRDVNATQKLEFSSRSHGLMFGERFNFFSAGESIVRIRHRMLESYLASSDSKTTSFVFEQIKSFKESTLLFYFSYDRMRVTTSAFDTDSMTFRTDLIMGRVRDWFTPSIGFGVTSTDPVNNRAARGQELLLNPSARISKSFKKNWRASLRYDYQKNDSKDKTNFAYKKTITALELEYLF